MSRATFLEKQLEELRSQIGKNQLLIEALAQKIAAWQSENQVIENSLEESQKTAGESENQARARAEEILADAEAVVASQKAQLAAILMEIESLKEELRACEMPRSEAAAPTKRSGEPSGPGSNTRREEETRAGEMGPGEALNLPVTVEKTAYTIKLTSFLNARHFVTLGGKQGPVHAHSWQVAIEVKIPSQSADLVAFTSISDGIKSVVAPYENTVLNDIHPFNLIQPTTENIAMYFFNRLEDVLSSLGLGLGRLTLWETPTRGIEVDSRREEFDALTAGGEKIGETVAARAEAASAFEDWEQERIHSLLNDDPGDPDRKDVQPVKWEPEPVHQYSWRQYLAGVVIISLTALLAYYNVLSALSALRFPWGSDTWGHLFKADYLYHQILQGNIYPQFTEYWYNGSQPFRYWAPLPYYVLAGLRAVTCDIFRAGTWYVFVCALFGGLSWLFLARRMGLWPAVMAGAIWVVWLDNVRVAFAEGNLPRVLATALLPLLFTVFLQVLEEKRSIASILFTVILVHLVILCHAMIGAVYCLCLFWFAFWLWVLRGCELKDAARGVVVLAAGVVTSSWWLLPSLTGGITGVDAEAVRASFQFVPAHISLNPLYRFSNPETFYWGTSILLALAASFISWRSKPPWARSLIICSLMLMIITFPLMRGFYVILPLSHLLWPLRFTTFAALGILAGSFTLSVPDHRQPWLRSPLAAGGLMLAVFLALMVDCVFSTRLLAHTGARSFNLMQTAQFVKNTPGWRIATIDLSQLGSAPSFIFSETNGMEQVFGWAWQGAVTSKNIMLLNTGLENQCYPFLFRSCTNLGATELVVKDDVIKRPEAFRQAAHQAGYSHQATFGGISVWHSLDQPYLLEKKPECLVIGKYAGTVVLQFPQAEMGFSDCIDKYSVNYLRKFPRVILSGARWLSQTRAERIISQYAASGGKVYIELGGMPENVLAKQPEFLGVYGEPVTVRGGIEVFGGGRRFWLQPFAPQNPSWKSYVPMGLDHVDLEFSYYGNQAPIVGYKLVAGEKVWFLGGNLLFHAYKTGDPIVGKLLQDILDLRMDYRRGPVIPLEDYRASEQGYSMVYQSDHDFEGIIPVAFLDGTKVQVDGVYHTPGRFENLVQLSLPAGRHSITITFTRTPVYQWGTVLSLLSILLIAAWLGYYNRCQKEQGL